MTLEAQIESVLFIVVKPLSFKKIAKLLNKPVKQVKDNILKLQKKYQSQNRGIRISLNQTKAEMVSAPGCSKILKKFVKETKKKISQAKIETLTLLAYQGPLTQSELEQIRGVNCSLILKNLKIENLIDKLKENGFLKYQVSTKFLNNLGITKISELPNYQKFKKFNLNQNDN